MGKKIITVIEKTQVFKLDRSISKYFLKELRKTSVAKCITSLQHPDTSAATQKSKNSEKKEFQREKTQKPATLPPPPAIRRQLDSYVPLV